MSELKFREKLVAAAKTNIEVINRPDLVAAFHELAKIIGDNIHRIQVVKNNKTFTLIVKNSTNERGSLGMFQHGTSYITAGGLLSREHLQNDALNAAIVCVRLIGQAITPKTGMYIYEPETKQLG